MIPNQLAMRFRSESSIRSRSIHEQSSPSSTLSQNLTHIDLMTKYRCTKEVFEDARLCTMRCHEVSIRASYAVLDHTKQIIITINILKTHPLFSPPLSLPKPYTLQSQFTPLPDPINQIYFARYIHWLTCPHLIKPLHILYKECKKRIATVSSTAVEMSVTNKIIATVGLDESRGSVCWNIS